MALIDYIKSFGVRVERIGLEAGPLSQWLYGTLRECELPVELLETRHVKAALSAMPVKTDRNDARGLAQLMRLGWFRPVHCSSRGCPRRCVRCSPRASWCSRSSTTSR